MEDNIKKIRIEYLLALANILDNYKEFSKDVDELLTDCKYYSDIYKIINISNGKKVLGGKKIKKFYKENKETIDIINKYSGIYMFIANNYSINKKDEYKNLDYYYDYFIKNKDNLNNIIILLEKINNLGIERIIFDENIDFTKQQYSLNTNFRSNSEFNYLENMEAIPSYEKSIVNYKSKQSNYKIIINNNFADISKYDNSIVLNSLLFDPNTLPDNITKENTFDKIVALKNNIEEESNILKDSIYLSVSISDLNNKYDEVKNIINGLTDIKTKNDLQLSLIKIKEDLTLLNLISENYNNKIANNYLNLDKSIINDEKKKYLRKREPSFLD